MTDKITLKHLCREFDLEPYDLRKHLRANMKHRSNARWNWQPDDKELIIAKRHAKELQHAKKAKEPYTK